MTQEDIVAPIKTKIAELNAQMQSRSPETGIELIQEEGVPAMSDDKNDELQELIAALTGDDERHKVAYATEGGQFTNAGIPTIICGPGSIEQAHKADEFVTLSEIERCDGFLQKLLESCTVN
jgi:acetylornithine deacetylase